jgi:hypothetical protein
MTAEGPDGLAATVAGEGAKFSLATGVTEIALSASFAVPSSQTFAHMLPPEAPELRNVTGRFDVGGSLDALSIANARIEVEGPNGLSATADGQIGRLSLLPVLAIKDLAFDLEARSPGTDNVLQLVGLSLPELGPVRARATLRERDDLFTLAAIDVLVGPDNRPAVHATGQIGDIFAMKQIKLSGDFQIATARLLGPDVPVEKSPLGSVHGRFDISDADGSIGLEALSAQLVDTDLLTLSVKGLFDDFKLGDDFRMDATLTVPNVSALGRELGFEVERLGNFSFKGEVSGSDERFRAEGKARLGETDLTGTLSGTLKGERPALRAKLHSPVFHLADFGLLPDADTPESTATAVKEDRQVKTPAPGFLFSEEPLDFSSLKAFDLDLDVQLDEVEGIQFDIDTANMQFSLEDGLLKVDPLLFNFAGGRIEMRLVVDARTETPAVGLDIVADDVDLGDVLAQMEAEVPLDGELDTVLSLKAGGLSPRALASSFEGDLDLAISEGHIQTGLLDLTVTNPVAWMFSRSARKGYSELNCLVVRFDIAEGVAKSVALLLDTTNVRVEGEGNINFQDEVMAIAFSPRAKKRRLIAISTPFAIEGPLSGPSVNVNATGAATRVIGQTVVSPLNLLGSLMPLVNDRGTDAENLCLRLK